MRKLEAGAAADASEPVRVTVRQLRDIAHRLLWHLDLPAGFEESAVEIVLTVELSSGGAFRKLLGEVEAGTQVDPSRVVRSRAGSGYPLLSAHGQTSLYVGPLAIDLAGAMAAAHGLGCVIARDVSTVALASGLVELAYRRLGMPSFVTIQPASGDLQDVVIDAAAPYLDGRAHPRPMSDLEGSGWFILTCLSPAARQSPQDAASEWSARQPRDIFLDRGLWDALFERSRDVLAPMQRIFKGKED